MAITLIWFNFFNDVQIDISLLACLLIN